MRLLKIAPAGILVAAIVATSAAPASASTKYRRCGTEKALSGGQVFAVRAHRTKCKLAKQVAGGWFNVAGAKRVVKVYDPKGRAWKCRVTLRATGTDPGYNPYTHIRCTRKASVVRFKLRS